MSIHNLAPTVRAMFQVTTGSILLQTTELAMLPQPGHILRIAGGRYRVTETPFHWENLENDPRVRIEIEEEVFDVNAS